MESLPWSKSTSFFSEKFRGIFHVLIVGERLCGRAKPLEWVSRAASPLYLTIRNQWSRQTGPPHLPITATRTRRPVRTNI